MASQQHCGHASAGEAQPTISVDRRTIGVDETAVVQVTGSNFLVPPHRCGTSVFGGVYVFFGWTAPGNKWGPSHRSSNGTQGLFGTTFSYPGEGGGGEIRDDGSGVVRLVAFTRGGDSGGTTDFHMDGSGNWRANVTVRGASYTFSDIRTGATNTVDCRVVQCGIFTIGAHGKASPANERFTPISFTDGSGQLVAPTNPGGGGQGGTTGRSGQPFRPDAPHAGGGPSSGHVDAHSLDDNPLDSNPSDSNRSDTTTADGSSPEGSDSSGDDAPAQVGSVGGAVGQSDLADVAENSDTQRAVEAEKASAVQVFDDDGNGSSGGLAIGVAAAVLVAALAGFVITRIRHRRGREVAS